MDKAIKERVVAALESGEYQQASGRLRYTEADREFDNSEDRIARRTGFCCLGVICDLVKDELGYEWKRVLNHNLGYVGEHFTKVGSDPQNEEFTNMHYLPHAVRDHVGLQRDEERRLAILNDEGKSFKEIAAFIRDQF